MKTTSFDDLSRRIEQVVQEHIASSRKAAAAAVERAFASTSGARRRVGPRLARSESSVGRRRAPAELTSLSEALYRAVCAKPGAPMAALAIELGASPRELHRPMSHLRKAGRVRSVGQRHLTRYFPIAEKAAKSP